MPEAMSVRVSANTAAMNLFNEIVQAVWYLSRSHAQAKWEGRIETLKREYLRLLGEEAFIAIEPGDWWATLKQKLDAETKQSGWIEPPSIR